MPPPSEREAKARARSLAPLPKGSLELGDARLYDFNFSVILSVSEGSRGLLQKVRDSSSLTLLRMTPSLLRYKVLRYGQPFFLKTNVPDAATFRVDQGIDPNGRKVSLCSVEAAISRPQTRDLVLLSHDAQTPSPAVGEGLAPPARGKLTFFLRARANAQNQRRAARRFVNRRYGADGRFAPMGTFPMRRAWRADDIRPYGVVGRFIA